MTCSQRDVVKYTLHLYTSVLKCPKIVTVEGICLFKVKGPLQPHASPRELLRVGNWRAHKI